MKEAGREKNNCHINDYNRWSNAGVGVSFGRYIRWFQIGGWSAPYGDKVVGEDMQKLMRPADYLLGRKTFEIFTSYWPQNTEMWPSINNGTKYVMSKTMKKADWKNTVFIESLGDVKKLKQF